MQKEKIALITLVVIVVAALSVFLIAVNTDIFENLFKEKLTISEGDCADVNYIGRYASNNTIFDKSYQYVENKSGGTPLKIFVSYNASETSPKPGYSAGMIKGFMEGLIGMQEGQTKIIGPIPPADAYGANKFTTGAIFTTNYLAIGLNQTVEVTNYTSTNLSVKWINIENFGNFTMPQYIIKNLQDYLSANQTDIVFIPPPYSLWKNSTKIVSNTSSDVTVFTTPTKKNNLSTTVQPVYYGEKQMLIFPDVTNATWNTTVITITSSPIIGKNYTFPTPDGYGGTINTTVHIEKINNTKINTSISYEGSNVSQYFDSDRTFVFNRTFIMPRLYKNIPADFAQYYYATDIQNAGYSLNPLAGESLTFEVIVEKVYKTSQGTS